MRVFFEHGVSLGGGESWIWRGEAVVVGRGVSP